MTHRRIMRPVVNFYCDESCHLPNDGQQFMVLGALRCPAGKAREVAERIREIKRHSGVSQSLEAKWGKVSPARVDLYVALLDYFFDDDDLKFRALVAPKRKLNHEKFHQDHDKWYYKMYFYLLRELLDPKEESRVFIDIKDTRGGTNVEKLGEVLSNDRYDFRRDLLTCVQQVRSHEVEQMQLADLLVGVVSYVNRGLEGNAGKQALVDRARQRSHYDLTRTTLRREEKFNIFVWNPQDPGE